MTLEEAKKRIADCMKQSTDDYNLYEDEVSRGEASGYKMALNILDKVEPVANPDKLTLAELARELSKIFGFCYLVAEGSNLYGYNIKAFLLKPKYISPGKFWYYEMRGNRPMVNISFADLRFDLDFSEYKDENGEIDYSRCIVEVSDDIE